MVDGVVLVPSHPSYVYLCVTFRTDGEQDQTIISSYESANPGDPFREISASYKEIRIWGAKTKSSYVLIEHKTKKNEWTTIFVEWSDHESSFHVNGKEIHGVFTCKDPALFDVGGISIGGRDAGSSHSLARAISSLEIYVLGKTHGDGGILIV